MVMELPHYIRERDLRSHLSLIHGMYVGDVKDLDGLNAAHADSHGDPDALWWIGHTHDNPADDSPEVGHPGTQHVGEGGFVGTEYADGSADLDEWQF